MKSCFVIFKRMIDQWMGNNNQNLLGFKEFIFKEFVPLLIKIPLQSHIHFEDAGFNIVKLLYIN